MDFSYRLNLTGDKQTSFPPTDDKSLKSAVKIYFIFSLYKKKVERKLKIRPSFSVRCQTADKIKLFCRTLERNIRPIKGADEVHYIFGAAFR